MGVGGRHRELFQEVDVVARAKRVGGTNQFGHTVVL